MGNNNGGQLGPHQGDEEGHEHLNLKPSSLKVSQNGKLSPTFLNTSTGYESSFSLSNSTTASGVEGEMIKWQWLKTGTWTDFDDETCKLLEDAYHGDKKVFVLSNGFFGEHGGYEVNFNEMTQTRITTNHCRKIQRVTKGTNAITTCTSKDRDFSIHVEATRGGKGGPNKAELCQGLTEWRVLEAADPPGDCPICLCELRERIVRLSACNGHEFHEECIVECFDETNVFLKCPICAYIYGIKTGKQPTGTMKVTFLPVGAIPVSGYEQYGTIKIMYHFPSGIQGEEHEMPGCPYYGTARTCYLPDNDEGVEILNLLVIAFKRRLTFTIGTSVKTGKKNAVIWNGIHHKTSPTGGPTKYGYPDETYFKRVKEELALCGVS